MIDRIKSFFKSIQNRHFLTQGLALQEERERVKRLEDELKESHKANGELMGKYQDAMAKLSRVDKALNDANDSRHWLRFGGSWGLIRGKENLGND